MTFIHTVELPDFSVADVGVEKDDCGFITVTTSEAIYYTDQDGEHLVFRNGLRFPVGASEAYKGGSEVSKTENDYCPLADTIMLIGEGLQELGRREMAAQALLEVSS